jgi:hypothetical protein
MNGFTWTGQPGRVVFCRRAPTGLPDEVGRLGARRAIVRGLTDGGVEHTGRDPRVLQHAFDGAAP